MVLQYLRMHASQKCGKRMPRHSAEYLNLTFLKSISGESFYPGWNH